MALSIGLGLLLLSVFISQSSSHFLLNYPPTIGFDDDLEGTPPCGSFKVDFGKDNVTDFHVGGDAIALTSIHPQATWLFRATLDQNAVGNWSDLLPAVQQTGLGAYCERDVSIPASFEGSKGVIQVVQDAPDGILYQCAAVNFVAGAASSIPSTCTNVTGLSANYTTDPVLSSLPASASSTASSTASMTSSGASSTSSAASAAATIETFTTLKSIVWVSMLGFATLMGHILL